jgi:hypothetical protein
MTAAPADRGAILRDRIASALYEHMHPGSHWSDTSMPADWRPTYLEEADAVLAVLPASADRATVRDRIIAAIKSVRVRPELDPIVTSMIQAGSGFHLKDEEAAFIADAVLDVLPAPVDRGAILREAAVRLDNIHDYPSGDAVATGAYLSGMEHAANALRRMADEAREREAQANLDTLADFLPRMAEEICPGFPDRCPNLRTIEPDPPVHLGGVRCGCADEAPQPETLRCDVEFEGGDTCTKAAGHRTTQNQDPHTPPAVGTQQSKDADGDRIVAYSSPGGTALFCTRHRDELSPYWPPVFSEDLPDGGICAHSTCGADLLIPQQPEAAEGAQR